MTEKKKYSVHTLMINEYGLIHEALLQFDGKNATIAGPGNTGKTTCLNVLGNLITGKKPDRFEGGKDFGKIINNEADSASSTVVLKDQYGNGFAICQDLRRDSIPKIKIIMLDPNEKPLTVSEIRAFLPKIGLNIFEIAQKNDKDLNEFLLESFGVKDKIKEIQKERDAVYADRTLINREIERIKIEAASIVLPEGIVIRKVDTAALVAEKDRAQKLANEVSNLTNRILDKEKEIREAEERIMRMRQECNDMQARIDKIEIPNINTLNEQIASADACNSAVKDKERRDKLITTQLQNEALSKMKTAKIEELDKNKFSILEEINFPEGLTFDDGTLLYNGVPFAAQGDKKKNIIVSEICAKAVKNHPGDVMVCFLLDHAECLGKPGLKEVCEIAEKNGIQIISSYISEPGDIDGAIYIQEAEND